MEYSPTSTRAYIIGTVFVIASVAGVLTIFVAVKEESAAALVVAAGSFLLALVSWWGLLSWKPTIVTIREGVLEVSRGGRVDSYELTDSSTVVEFTGRPGSPTWTATVRTANGPRTILRANQVKPRQFERIVRYHRGAAQGPRPDGDAAG